METAARRAERREPIQLEVWGNFRNMARAMASYYELCDYIWPKFLRSGGSYRIFRVVTPKPYLILDKLNLWLGNPTAHEVHLRKKKCM